MSRPQTDYAYGFDAGCRWAFKEALRDLRELQREEKDKVPEYRLGDGSPEVIDACCRCLEHLKRGTENSGGQ